MRVMAGCVAGRFGVFVLRTHVVVGWFAGRCVFLSYGGTQYEPNRCTLEYGKAGRGVNKYQKMNFRKTSKWDLILLCPFQIIKSMKR